MFLRLGFLVSATLLSSCSPMPNTGLVGSSEAAVGTAKAPGAFGYIHWQAVRDSDRRSNVAKFTSIHPGANDGGFDTTTWTYVRGIEIDVNEATSGELGFSEAVVKFLEECAPVIDPTSESDRLRSGILLETDKARLILTRITWNTIVGPGPNKFDTVRIKNAKVQVFGTTAPASGVVSLDISLSVGNGSTFSDPVTVLEKKDLSFDPSLIALDCSSKTLKAATLDLGETGWFPRGSTNNIHVEVVEK